MSWSKFKITPAKQVKRCDMSTSEFTTIDAFFVNVNESSFPETVHKQSESASIVTLVEIHNVDVPAASSRDATVLSPTAGTRQWPSEIAINFETEFDSCSNSLTYPTCRHYYRQQFPGSSTQAAGKPRTTRLCSV